MSSRRNKPTESVRPRLRRSREEAARLLQVQIELGEKIYQRVDPGSYLEGDASELRAEYRRWSSFNKELLHQLFDTDEIANSYDVWIGAA